MSNQWLLPLYSLLLCPQSKPHTVQRQPEVMEDWFIQAPKTAQRRGLCRWNSPSRGLVALRSGGWKESRDTDVRAASGAGIWGPPCQNPHLPPAKVPSRLRSAPGFPRPMLDPRLLASSVPPAPWHVEGPRLLRPRASLGAGGGGGPQVTQKDTRQGQPSRFEDAWEKSGERSSPPTHTSEKPNR